MCKPVDVVFLNFVRAFDSVRPSSLCIELGANGFPPIFIEWVRSFPTVDVYFIPFNASNGVFSSTICQVCYKARECSLLMTAKSSLHVTDSTIWNWVSARCGIRQSKGVSRLLPAISVTFPLGSHQPLLWRSLMVARSQLSRRRRILGDCQNFIQGILAV